MAKAALWGVLRNKRSYSIQIFGLRLNSPDTETRKLGERTGLDTPVVPALNDVHLACAFIVRAVGNLLSAPPGEYARKGETQRN